MTTTAVDRRGVRLRLRRWMPVRCARRHDIRRRSGRALVLGLFFTGTVVVFAPGSGASSIGGLEAEAQQLADQITADNAQLAALGAQYLAEHSAYVGATVDEARLRIRIASDDRLVDHDVAAVRSAAIAAYVGAGSNGPIGLSWAAAPDVVVSSATYLSVASNRLDELAAGLVADRRHLGALLSARQQAARVASDALAATAASRSTVLTTVAAEERLYHSTNSKLDALVAAKAAAEAAAALARQEAAAAAAAKAAAVTSASSTVVSSGASAPPAITAGPPSPAGLSTSVTAAPQSVAADFAAIRKCESSDVYTLDTGNGYYGAYQFSAATWEGLGGVGLASLASPAAQDAAAYLLYQRSGDSFAAWGTCAAIAGIT